MPQDKNKKRFLSKYTVDNEVFKKNRCDSSVVEGGHARSRRAQTGKVEKMAELANLLIKHKVSRNQIAIASEVSPATITRLVNKGQWTESKEKNSAIRDGIFKCLGAAGANEREIRNSLDIQEEHKVSSLTSETMRFFSLVSNPFSPTQIQSGADVLQTSEHTLTVNRIVNAARRGEFIFIVGYHGAGKTTALNDATAKLGSERSCKICRILDPYTEGLKIGAIIDAMGRAVGINYNGFARSRSLEQISSALRQPTATPLLVIIDDGHALHPQTFYALKRLWDNMVSDFKHLISIVVLSQFSIFDSLKLDRFAEVRNHVEIYEIAGFISATEIQNYIIQRCRLLPGKWEKLFDPEVPNLIWEYERRNYRREGMFAIEPRQLNHICIDLLNKAVEMGDPLICTDTVKKYYR
jgi:type II secretory pathway predicted ATPase ExeA